MKFECADSHDLNLIQQFERQVRRTPHNIAVRFGKQELTYLELNAKANQLAGYLRASIQVKADTLIPIVIGRGLEMVVGMLGVLKAGAAYVPIHPQYPDDRVQKMLIGCAGMIVTQSSIAPKIQSMIKAFNLDTKWVELDNDWDSVATYSDENVANFTHHDDLAYVIYTSGTSGTPKGVMIQHDNLSSFFSAINKHFLVSADTVLLACTEFTFDISVLEIFLPLLHGGCCLIANKEMIANPSLVSDMIRQHKVSLMQATPAMWQLLLSENVELPVDLKIVCGGEALSPQLAKRLLTHVHAFWNVYGPTEATIWSTLHEFTRSDALNIITIGKPLANTSILIMDSTMHVLPDGEIGELHIAGAGLARGYINQNELTQSKFICHQVDANCNLRLYKTGDLARKLPDGTIEFLGRNDDQLKIRGFRIEAGEIESHLQNVAHVAQSVVLAKSIADDLRLIAYVVPVNSESVNARELDEHLKQYLPEYMLPNAYVMLDAMPLTAHGKIDRQALLRQPVNEFSSREHFNAPQTADEKLLATIWSELLKVPTTSLGIDTNFFLLGGHSLLAAQVITRVRALLKIELNLADIFSYATIRELAAFVASQRLNNKALATRPECKPRELSENNALSFAQERLWFLDQFQSGSPVYHIAHGLHLRGNVNLSALESAFYHLINRHEALRTVFNRVNDALVQSIIAIDDFPFASAIEVTSVNNVQEADVQAEIFVHAPFDLCTGPLLRVKLIQLGIDECLLVIVMHHIITDDWSMGIISHELGILYQAAITHHPADLLPLPVQYADYACWQRKWLQGITLQQQLNFWREQLANPTQLELPTDFPRPPVESFTGSHYPVALSPELSKQIRQLSLQENVTLFTSLFSVFAMLLGRYSGQEDIFIGTPVAGRVTQEIENVVGFFVNTLVLRSNLSGQPDFITLLKCHHQMALASFANQDAPFEKVVDAVGAPRDPGRSPLFQTMFVLQNAPKKLWELADLDVTPYPMGLNISKFDLTFVLSEDNDQISGVIEFNTSLFKTDTIRRLWDHFTVLLQQVVSDPAVPISKLSLLTDAEQQQILIDWNQTEGNFSYDTTLHQLFEIQVEKNPDHTAISCMGLDFTYRMLNERANQLAHYLRRQHAVQPDMLVPIMADKSVEMIVGLLGILKAGGAYVPINPALPQERIQFMLDDCKARLILVQETLKSKWNPNTISATNQDREIVYLSAESEWAGVSDFSRENLQSLSGPENLAYLIYTSGSTGQPKGVMIEHRGVVNTTLSQIPLFNITNTSRILQFASFSFDSSVCEIFRTLLAGATLVLNPADLNTPGDILADTLIRQKITTVTLPPAALELLPVRHYPDLCTLASAGEACTAALMNRWVDDYHCINAYGPTEISVCATLAICERSESKPPIGKPLKNVSVYVLDKYLQPLPVNVRGELYVGGPGVARGYLNHAALTQVKFIPNPFSPDPAARLYKTGDMVRWLPDGSLDYLGRDDDQVKIRGFRIELGEIERHLQGHPAVRQCVVLKKQVEHDAKLIAYLIPNAATVIDSMVLRDYLGARLPDYMVPNAFVVLDKMSLTTNRKIDKNALLSKPLTIVSSAKTYQHPRNEIEFQLVRLWEKLLNVSSIGITDDFFSLGGHSLLLITLLAQVEKIFHKKFPVSLIYAKPTIEQLAAALMAEENSTELNPIVKLRETGHLPPIYLIHEVTGIPFTYLTLSRYIDADYPIYGIQDPTAGKQKRFATIQEMAACYVDAIRKVQKNGPYYFVGWCLGGVIAYEMAQQLLRQGESVAKLILIDSPMDLHKIRKHKSYTDQFNDVKTMLNEGDLLTLYHSTQDKSTWINDMAAEFMHRIMLMREYRPAIYSDPDAVTLIKASESSGPDDIITPTSDNGWQPYVADINVHFAPGNHQSMIKEPHASQLAAIINNEVKLHQEVNARSHVKEG